MDRAIVGSQFSVTEAMSFSACAARMRLILLMEHPWSRNSLQKATAPRQTCSKDKVCPCFTALARSRMVASRMASSGSAGLEVPTRAAASVGGAPRASAEL